MGTRLRTEPFRSLAAVLQESAANKKRPNGELAVCISMLQKISGGQRNHFLRNTTERERDALRVAIHYADASVDIKNNNQLDTQVRRFTALMLGLQRGSQDRNLVLEFSRRIVSEIR